MEQFFEPLSVVLIGVSRQTGPGAYNNLEMLQRYGYPGRIYLVHPKVREILGLRAYHRVADLPEPPDLAVISLGRERVLTAFHDCVARGIRRVVVISQGFADADDRGKALQAELVHTARQDGVRVLGPNTMGIVNPFARFSTAFVDVPREAEPPGLALVAQSGVFQAGYVSFTGRLGKSIDVGNACDVDVVEVLEYLGDDPQTRMIVLHLEGLGRGREFLHAAAALARRKPIIVFKTGRSAAGARAAMSHTGSLVGEDAIFDLACERAGLLRVRTLGELRAVCRAFLHFRPLAGPRLGVVTATGACGIMAVDALADHGLEPAPFPERLRDLEDPHIAWHHLHNPVDIWPLGMVSGSFTQVFRRAVTGLLQDEQVHGVLAVAPALSSPLHADLDPAETVRAILPENTGHKPLALFLYGNDARRQEQSLASEADVACFDSLEEAVLALAATWRFHRLSRSPEPAPEFLLPRPSSASRPQAAPLSGLLVGEAALELLRRYQIPVVPGRLVQEDTEALAFARQQGYPLAAKIISPQWLHKSDLGGVLLGIGSEAELLRASRDLRERFQRHTPAGELQGILLQKQVQGLELLLGVKRDPQFGPVMAVGLGGIYTEVFREVARAFIPVDAAQAMATLQSLKIYPMLQGVRGQAGVNLPALVQTMVSLSRLALDYPEILELDLNPIVANAQGRWCVDARILTSEQ